MLQRPGKTLVGRRSEPKRALNSTIGVRFIVVLQRIDLILNDLLRTQPGLRSKVRNLRQSRNHLRKSQSQHSYPKCFHLFSKYAQRPPLDVKRCDDTRRLAGRIPTEKVAMRELMPLSVRRTPSQDCYNRMFALPRVFADWRKVQSL